MIPNSISAPDAPSSSTLDLIPNKWYLISSPLDPGVGKRELSMNFTNLGIVEKTWRAVKWDHTFTGSSDTGGYRIYSGPGTGFPELLPGRGFWV